VSVTGNYGLEHNIYNFGVVYDFCNVSTIINMGQYMFLVPENIKPTSMYIKKIFFLAVTSSFLLPLS
jgi:hypothetical protein